MYDLYAIFIENIRDLNLKSILFNQDNPPPLIPAQFDLQIVD